MSDLSAKLKILIAALVCSAGNAAFAQGEVAAPLIPARPASLAFIEDQKPMRAEIKTLDHPERLATAIGSSEKVNFAISRVAPPLSSRPATLTWAPDQLSDVPKQLGQDRLTLQGEVR
jgi:hypothetical protein